MIINYVNKSEIVVKFLHEGIDKCRQWCFY